ncbi:uncharacterized protein LOC133780419 [Humulus lupulus]|uniref:uncharacterized protein LOC133780419 n=1 Tax=Humulus lupulus TaxID=3486 RepID=UPI002B414FDE|nr:uncharacterized protein LOC133780419 [Humulus lupulus]XP_062076161.1 uncharacterized protein LOC133780419 [Humulus lupulus]
MKKKGRGPTRTTTTRLRTRTRKHSATEFLETPLTTASTPNLSRHSPIFRASSKKRQKSMAAASPTSPPFTSPFHPPKILSSIFDLKDMVASRLDDFKKCIERSHSEIFNDLDAFYYRLHKRFKIQSQECQLVSDEAEKEYKKMSERIGESQEAMMTSYSEFIADAQTSTSHASKSISKLSQSVEKAVDTLRSRYVISAA